MNLKTSKIFLSSSIEYVILDKEVINNNLKEVIDFITRDTKLSLEFLILTTTDSDPEKILSNLSEFNANPATNLSEIIKLSKERYGISYSLTSRELLNNYLAYGIENVFPNIYLNEENEEESTKLLEQSNIKNYTSIIDLVTFTKDKKAIHLNKNEALGYNIINNNITNATITASCNDDYLSIETLKSKTKLIDNLKNNKITIKSNLDVEIIYYGCKYDLEDIKSLEKIKTILSEEIKKCIEETVQTAKTNKFDYIGIGNYIYKNNKKYFDFKNKNWNEEGLNKINFDYDIKINLYSQGNLKGDIQ